MRLLRLLLLCLLAFPAYATAPPTQLYPATIKLDIDATDIARKIFAIHEQISVQPGALTLLFPEWRLGAHAPAGRLLAQFAGFRLSAQGKEVAWRRDPSDVYAFQCEVPPGVTLLDAEFQFLSPLEANEGDNLVTPEMLALHWEAMLVYPAGFTARSIMIAPRVTLPAGWQFAGALTQEGKIRAAIGFKPVNLEELIDSPIYAGHYLKRIDLDPGAKIPVFLDMFADDPKDLEASAEQIEFHRAVVSQAYKLFGGAHYDHYDFLMAISDEFGFAGLEHHQSGENSVRANYFSEWDQGEFWRSNLVTHEYIHSWDGKFRRPADQMIANFNQPMQDSLLWVYEGLTSYYGHVVAARSGMVAADRIRELLGLTAALYDQRAGRAWRSLQDTTNDPIINRRSPLGWVSWQRAEDYYSEGELIWFDADSKIRELSGDQRSLDDFARGFFGVAIGSHVPLPYRFEDVVAALTAVQPYDWAGFLRSRLDGHGPGAPLDGLARSGWKLAFDEKPTDAFKHVEAYRKIADFSYSLGIVIDREGRVASVVWDGPAFKAGLTIGQILLAVNGKSYQSEGLKAAITAAKSSDAPIELLFKQNDHFRTVRLDYHQGLKYPRLEPIPGAKDRLTAILQKID